jgi:hypothetical protein
MKKQQSVKENENRFMDINLTLMATAPETYTLVSFFGW